MAERPIWRGHLRLALVSCPVSLHSMARASGVPSSAVLNGSGGGPPNGTLINATERNTSGLNTPQYAATGEPQSCPTTAATER